jgi:hypothetical protein
MHDGISVQKQPAQGLIIVETSRDLLDTGVQSW